MKRYLWPRSPLAWVVIAAVIFLVLGTVVPPLYNNQTRPLAFDQNINTVTAPSAGVGWKRRVHRRSQSHRR